MSLDNRTWFQKGLKDGIPIALGYFAAVSYTHLTLPTNREV